jgi:hypothetical protein
LTDQRKLRDFPQGEANLFYVVPRQRPANLAEDQPSGFHAILRQIPNCQYCELIASDLKMKRETIHITDVIYLWAV